jgi:predicted nuclease with TOPRIM domain
MGSADDGDAAAGFRGKLMAMMPNLDKAIEQLEQAMRQLEAAWAQSERNQETISKLSGEAETLKEDRAKLANELDEVRARAEELAEANRQAARRIDLAMARVRTVIGEEA